MPAECFKKLLALGLVQAAFCAFALPCYALSNYSRGPGAPYNSHTPNRFLYTNPFYQSHAAQPKPECKPHGQARCMTPKKPSPFVLTRQNPGMQKPVNPFVRKIFQPPPIQRIN